MRTCQVELPSLRLTFLGGYIRQGTVNLDSADTYGRTPLLRCAEIGRLPFGEALLACGAAVDASDDDGSVSSVLDVYVFGYRMFVGTVTRSNPDITEILGQLLSLARYTHDDRI